MGHSLTGTHLTEKAPGIGSFFFSSISDFPSVSRRCIFLTGPHWTFVSHARKDLSPLKSSEDDGARTRDLCRDSESITRNS
jgi:hypothetical protein